MLVAAKQEALAPLLCSLHVEKELDKAKKKKNLETKYSFLAISSAIFSLHFILLLFIGIFCPILIWWTVAQMTPAIL